jgi:hypothetical protein
MISILTVSSSVLPVILLSKPQDKVVVIGPSKAALAVSDKVITERFLYLTAFESHVESLC